MTTTSPHRPAPSDIQVGPPQRPARPRRRHRLPSWGLKSAAAVTGILLTAFVAIHLFGNLKVFQGPEAFNGYALWLREALYPFMPKGMVLWATRLVMLAAVVVHIVAATLIWARGRRGRGGHRARLHGAQSWGAWLMAVTGVAVLAFVVFHLLDLTLGAAPAASAGFAAADAAGVHAYENLVASFERPLAAWSYVAAMLFLGIHVAKGFGTMVVDLGVMGRRLRATVVAVGGLVALAVLFGNGVIPVMVQAGWLA